MICYDLETCLMKKGKKRKDGLILSIGAVDILSGQTFHCYVNPLSTAKKDFTKHLDTYGVRMKPTQTVITNIHWRHEKAKEMSEALDLFEQFISKVTLILPKPILVAHNGRSFDHPILLGSYDRIDRKKPELCFLDSWHDMTKKGWPKQRVHKLQVLHQSLCPNSLLAPKWHQALDDATALSEIIVATAVEEVARRPRQAWTYACKHSNILDELNSKYKFKLSAEHSLCSKSMRLWPEVVRKNGLKAEEFKEFCVVFCINRIWQKIVR